MKILKSAAAFLLMLCVVISAASCGLSSDDGKTFQTAVEKSAVTESASDEESGEENVQVTTPSENATEETGAEETITKETASKETITKDSSTEENKTEEIAAEEETEPEPTVPDGLELKVTFIDVGQGDSAFVECDGHYMLIDGGTNKNSSLIYSFLKQHGVSNLDIIVGSHVDADHIGGLAGALNAATADLVLCPSTTGDTETFDDFKKYADRNGNGIVVPEVGDTYSLGAAVVTILGVNTCTDITNNTSIVLKVQYGSTSFLFTGDAEIEAENALLDSGYAGQLQADVLKVSHHGSDNATSAAFLKAVSPEYAVISVGEDNTYGHPTEEVLDRLKNYGVPVLRTDLQGNITFASDGTTLTYTVEKKPDADTYATQETQPETTEAGTRDGFIRKNSTDDAADSTTDNTAAHYILNTNTKKIHLPDCSSVKQMKEKNKQDFYGTVQEAIDMGYSRCQVCNP